MLVCLSLCQSSLSVCHFLGQLISDDISEIINKFNDKFYTTYSNQLTTKSASAQYDDSYLGKAVSFHIFPNILDCAFHSGNHAVCQCSGCHYPNSSALVRKMTGSSDLISRF